MPSALLSATNYRASHIFYTSSLHAVDKLSDKYNALALDSQLGNVHKEIVGKLKPSSFCNFRTTARSVHVRNLLRHIPKPLPCLAGHNTRTPYISKSKLCPGHTYQYEKLRGTRHTSLTPLVSPKSVYRTSLTPKHTRHAHRSFLRLIKNPDYSPQTPPSPWSDISSGPVDIVSTNCAPMLVYHIPQLMMLKTMGKRRQKEVNGGKEV
ncbi:hypothetical protein QCA50_008307 [Cerrena zonata]|uniref:Uncharacterized protein n=1 Tax=Cerrena zonata TaxID=2478898 RepID=A0AAW0G638_9APHY